MEDKLDWTAVRKGPQLHQQQQLQGSVFREALDVCLSMAPLGGLFLNHDGFLDMRNFTPQEYPGIVQFPCGLEGAQTVEKAIYYWLVNFRQVSIPRLENAFNAATFVANQA
ncbi:unnamed protein product [Penicillium viridicatum]